jgi:hypothetical protein
MIERRSLNFPRDKFAELVAEKLVSDGSGSTDIYRTGRDQERPDAWLRFSSYFPQIGWRPA